MKKPKGYWTLKRCLEDAGRYSSRSEWRKNSGGGFNAASKNGWLDDCCGHMSRPKAHNLKWTFEKCLQDASQYSSRSEWKQNSKGYDTASRNGWLEECCGHMEFLTKPNGYWTLEQCREDAAQYSTRAEWAKDSGSAYQMAHRNGWLDECCGNMEKVGNKFKRAIYAFEFEDNSVYIGLTHRYSERRWSHENKSSNRGVRQRIEAGVGYRFVEFGEWLSPEEAAEEERKTLEDYAAKSWEILNLAKTGAIGGSERIWTLEKCVEDAAQYSSRIEWRQNSNGYDVSAKNGWLEECCGHMEFLTKPNGYWTLEQCREDAAQYSTRTEWKQNLGGGYSAANKNGWIEECCGHMEVLRKNWTLEECLEDAKNYETRSKWKNSSYTAYCAAQSHGWLDLCCEHMTRLHKKHGYWTLERCQEDALHYSTISEWREKSSGYATANKNKWVDLCTGHMEALHKSWTLERCREDAAQYSTRTEWSKNSNGYGAAARNGWLEECCAHMTQKIRKHGYWTLERCYEDASKYSSRSEWKKKSPAAYDAARRKGWREECFKYLNGK